MFEHHVVTGLCQLGVAIVVGIVADEAEGVALYHPDVSKSLEGVGEIVEMCAVAIEVGTHMTEVYLAMHYLCSVVAELVVVQVVGMNKIDALVLLHRLRFLAWRALLLGRLHGKYHA